MIHPDREEPFIVPRPGPNVTSDADTQPGSDSLFPTGFSGGGALVRSGSVGTGEIADGSVASADLNLASVAAAIAARSELTGTYATLGTAASLPGTRLRAVSLGDSTTAGGLRSTDGTVVQIGNTWSAMDGVGVQQAGPQSWFTWACLLSGGRLLPVYNAGIHSDTTTGMLARFTTDVVAKNPDVVFIGDAHNDFSVGSGISETATRANITAMVKAAQAAGILPIIRLIYPDNSTVYAHAIRRHNHWLRRFAATNHLITVDTYAAVVDTTSTSGAWVAANTSDGTHATTAGAILAGQRVLADLGGLLRGNTTAWGPYAATDRVGGIGRTVTDGATTSGSPNVTSSTGAFASAKDVGRPVTGNGVPASSYIVSVTNSTTIVLSQNATVTATGVTLTFGPHPNLVSNPLMQDDINTDGVADGWTINGTVTKSLVTDAAIVGQAQSAAITASTSTGYMQFSVDGKNISTGDRLKWSGVAKILGASGSLNFDLEWTFPGASTTYTVKPLGQTVSVDTGWFYYECEAVVPAGATLVRIGYGTFAGTGTLLLAQQSVVNVTNG